MAPSSSAFPQASEYYFTGNRLSSTFFGPPSYLRLRTSVRLDNPGRIEEYGDPRRTRLMLETLKLEPHGLDTDAGLAGPLPAPFHEKYIILIGSIE
jgi:hypothetical protein